MTNNDRIEFYNVDGKPGRDLVATAKSSMVPDLGSKISIRKQTWEVVGITYALDNADDATLTGMRANVNLAASK